MAARISLLRTRVACVLIACSLFTIVPGVFSEDGRVDRAPALGLPVDDDLGLLRNAGCDFFGHGEAGGYAYAGTPAGPCPWDAALIDHDFGIRYSVLHCPPANVWDCFFETAQSPQSFRHSCRPGTSVFVDWVLGETMFFGATCDVFMWPSNLDPGQWDHWRGYGWGVDVRFTHTDNPVDAVTFLLL